ncbi:glycerophosphodiester phosphodiesterase family protein [Haliea sp. E17]|uniref:glycerophosphodiester phosphodiesterase family protein n=1 Tax=Haliea sp. E17 TaxID=3401576 RepID=UPI003AABD4F0
MRLVYASALIVTTLSLSTAVFAGQKNNDQQWGAKAQRPIQSIQLGPRPFFLVADMDESALKNKLESCSEGPFRRTDFSIGHRGAPLQFPEHTRESYAAAARQGAGIIECDVTFTQDKELVCRHSQCDLHTTTNILTIPDLAAKCSTPFQPAVLDEEGNVVTPASAQCCTSDITLAEFRQLQGKMDGANRAATTPEEYQHGTAGWRTDLYADRGTLLTHKESIALFQELGVKMTPELKSPSVAMPFDSDGDGVGDYSQADYAQQMIDEYKAAGVPASDVFAQSFDLNDVLYWIAEEPGFGTQAVFLDGRYGMPGFDHRDPTSWTPSMADLVADGVQIIAPPIYMLVEVQGGEIVPSIYAQEARNAGLDIIAWSFERDGPLANGGGFYYSSLNGMNPNPVSPEPGVIDNDGDMLEVLDVLARDVGIIGLFSDWPASVTYYANCMNLK